MWLCEGEGGVCGEAGGEGEDCGEEGELVELTVREEGGGCWDRCVLRWGG